MPSWRNWSGKLASKPQRLLHLYSETQAAALAQSAALQGQRIRAVGAGHSHQSLVQNQDLIVDLLGLSGVISSDPQAHSAWVWGGSRIYTLGTALAASGLALSNQGDIDQQTICGATATGTHGTGAQLGSLSSRVIGARIALANGELVDCGPGQEADLWQACRLHLGALGLITRVRLALEPSYCLLEQRLEIPLEQALADIQSMMANNRHCEFFWYPQTDQAHIKLTNKTDRPPVYPLAEEGERCGWSHEVLPNHRPIRHTEMEYSVPADQGPACMQAIQGLLTKQFREVRWPVEYRALGQEDVWLSTACDRPTVTISVHQGVEEDEGPYFRACEEIFLAFQGRPHWGKVNYLGGKEFAALYPKWSDWWAVRDRVDPKGAFLNPYLKSIRP